MILFSKKEQPAFLLILILIFSYFSFSSSMYVTNFFASSEIDKQINCVNNPISTSPFFGISDNSHQVLRVLDWGLSDPFYSSWAFDSLLWAPNPSSPGSFIFDTLVDYDFETGEIIPSLAQNWVVTNDSKNWLFILREDVKFHDNSKFNASTVKFNYDRLIDPNHSAYVTTPVFALDDLPLESVDIINDYRVMFTFSKSFSPFINVHASTIEIVSPNSFQSGNITNPIGTGPYKFSKPTNDSVKQVFTFQRNSDYFRGVPPFEQVEYITYHSLDDSLNALHTNEVDIIGWGAHLLENNSNYWNISSREVGTIRLGWLNQQREEFRNPKVRQALNFAIDKEEYIKQTDEGGYFAFTEESFISQSFIPRYLPYWDSSIPGYPYNVTKANELLDDAGYPRGSDGYRFAINITVPDDSSRADLIVGYFDSIGINCTIVNFPFWDCYAALLGGDYEMTIFGWTGLHDPSFMSNFLHSNGKFNTGGYSNFVLDYLLDLAIESPIHQEREFYFKVAQIVAHADAPYLLLPESPYYYPRANHVVSFVRFSRNGRPSFNYSTNLKSSVHTYSNITISSKAVYFPFAGVVISQSDNQDIAVTLKADYNLGTFLPSFDGSGRFYEVTIDLQKGNTYFRCYYDPDEIEDLSVDELYHYNPNSNSWSPLKIISSNASLRYVEVELPGGTHLLSFGKEILLITYKLVPVISIIFGSILFFAILTIFYNQIRINRYKRRYNI